MWVRSRQGKARLRATGGPDEALLVALQALEGIGDQVMPAVHCKGEVKTGLGN